MGGKFQKCTLIAPRTRVLNSFSQSHAQARRQTQSRRKQESRRSNPCVILVGLGRFEKKSIPNI